MLEKAGIPVDYIAGTSIGSIVGGLYAAGYTATELDTMFCQQEWLSLITDRRSDLGKEPYKVKDGVTYIFGFPVMGNIADGEGCGLEIAGIFNRTQTFSGLQIAAVNYAKYGSGLQIGVVNITEQFTGLQIGVLNCIRDSKVPMFPVLNFWF